MIYTYAHYELKHALTVHLEVHSNLLVVTQTQL